MRTKRKPTKKAALRKLHETLRSLLDKPVREINDEKHTSGIPEILPTPKSSSAKRVKKYSLSATKGKDDSAFVLSKEDQLIPKLSDNEIMERHKLADENMRRVWTNIIRKYESIEDQGDVLDLYTGELVEDNGHIRGLSNDNSAGETRYQSVLKDIIELKKDRDNDKFALWGDDDVEDPEDGDYEIENDQDDGREEETDDDTDYADYKQLLKGKIEAEHDNVDDV
ncbi:hypothetical protein HG536_0B04890 [Torulaspora globosa]|uniref:Uncharacterized protein n=1 Tax=Torulaspora globosa TaxID=48254 RepID=A0A7G3ZDN9_9SACH|nr:uncharacterized protein HG536_0B04890 [Torulaspora globosa]QLL31625.1 hypothetical protein HG536_0B04890 [Torulaspora globosa]